MKQNFKALLVFFSLLLGCFSLGWFSKGYNTAKSVICATAIAPIYKTDTIKRLDTFRVSNTVFKEKLVESGITWVTTNNVDTIRIDSTVWRIVRDTFKVPVNVRTLKDTLKGKFTTSFVNLKVAGDLLEYSQITQVDSVPPNLIKPCPKCCNFWQKLFKKCK